MHYISYVRVSGPLTSCIAATPLLCSSPIAGDDVARDTRNWEKQKIMGFYGVYDNAAVILVIMHWERFCQTMQVFCQRSQSNDMFCLYQ